MHLTVQTQFVGSLRAPGFETERNLFGFGVEIELIMQTTRHVRVGLLCFELVVRNSSS
jgi:hypothetical protein